MSTLCSLTVLGSSVSFILKLDECQIVKGRRLERLSVTLMNDAMQTAKVLGPDAQLRAPTFSVQSEKEIWWLGAFEVPKETHDVLSWMFTRIPFITEVIKAQIAGEKLEVEGLGTFNVDWHLGGDLKTIKCMLGCKQGANCLYPCPFCIRGYKKKRNRNQKKRTQDVEEDNEDVEHQHNQCEDGEWDEGILQCPMLEEPNRSMKDNNWNPIINFSLDNVHFCTLHAFMRIFDRLLKLHIDYAFTMKPIQRSKESLCRVEELLNSIGCHGGNVQIVVKDTSDSHEVAQKVSMSGGKARRFFEKPAKKPTRRRSNHVEEQAKPWELWKELCKFTTDNEVDPIVVNHRRQVWASFNKVLRLMNRSHTTVQERSLFQENLLEFTKSVVTSWGETNITHYMVFYF